MGAGEAKEGGGELCTTLLQLHFHRWPHGCKSGSRRPFLTFCVVFFSPFYFPALHTSLTRSDCQYLIWTHYILLASQSQMLIFLTSEFRRWNLNVWLQMFWTFSQKVWNETRYGLADTTTNVTGRLLTDNLIKQFHCLDIQLTKQSYIAKKKEKELSHFYSCSLSMHVFLFTPTPKLSVWQLPVRKKREGKKNERRGENRKESR